MKVASLRGVKPLIAIMVVALLPQPLSAAPAPQPLPQVGSCPSGYSSDAHHCMPGWSARYAVMRDGSCPSNYGSDGAYCVASSRDAKTAIPRNGSCPSGYSSDGNYCVANK